MSKYWAVVTVASGPISADLTIDGTYIPIGPNDSGSMGGEDVVDSAKNPIPFVFHATGIKNDPVSLGIVLTPLPKGTDIKFNSTNYKIPKNSTTPLRSGWINPNSGSSRSDPTNCRTSDCADPCKKGCEESGKERWPRQMTKRLTALLLTGFASSAFCQTSAYQDTDSNTSIYLRNAKTSLVYNVSDAKFTVGYLTEPLFEKHNRYAEKCKDDLIVDIASKLQQTRDDCNEDAKLRDKLQKSHWSSSQVGLHFSGKPSTDLTGQILQSSSSPASVSGGGYYGVQGIGRKDSWLLVNGDYTRSTFNTVANSTTSPVAQHFNGFSVMPAWDALWSFIPNVTLLSGISAGINRTNNAGTLTKVQIDTTQASSGTVTVVKQQDAYQGAYAAKVGVPIYSDFAFIPAGANWLSIDLFERANVVPSARYTEGGVGLFIARPKKPTEVLGGISIAWKDGKSAIAVVGGWSF